VGTAIRNHLIYLLSFRAIGLSIQGPSPWIEPDECDSPVRPVHRGTTKGAVVVTICVAG
jgi:hypothetical protein